MFYSSKLIAAYMSDTHGIRTDYEDSVFGQDKFTVLPESLPLFNAQKGDLVLLANGMEAYRYSTPAKLDKGEKIVMRDGKPFHWPETTDAP